MSVPLRPDPPVVGKVTYNSIELYWNTEEREASPRSGSPTKGDHRLRYTIQEEEVGSRSKGFGNVYSGYSTSNVFEGLEPRMQYRYRLRCMNDNGASAWSSAVVVMTTIKPKTSEDLQKAVMKGDVDMVKKILPGMKEFVCQELRNTFAVNQQVNVDLYNINFLNSCTIRVELVIIALIVTSLNVK